MRIRKVPGLYAITRLAPSDEVPSWARPTPQSPFVSISRSSDELSIICESQQVPGGVTAQGDWACLMLEGPLDFGLVGILARVLTTLASVDAGVLAVSTYDTDYVLVPTEKASSAISALLQAEYEVL